MFQLFNHLGAPFARRRIIRVQNLPHDPVLQAVAVAPPEAAPCEGVARGGRTRPDAAGGACRGGKISPYKAGQAALQEALSLQILFGKLTATVHFFPFKFKLSKATSQVITSVADPGCLSRNQDQKGSGSRIPDPDPHRRILVFLIQKVVS
jgi:hypothetical protein